MDILKFDRDIYKDLKRWKAKAKKKPLLLMGARQIGKTTTLKEFGSKEYDEYVYLNLEKQQEIHSFFITSKEPQRILDNISLLHGKKITPEKTLLIIDEIQECPDAITALKYFEEEMSKLSIIGAGSLLGLSIRNNKSFPVGKVEFLEMYPLTFDEYLKKANEKLYLAFTHFLEKDKLEAMPTAFFNPLKEIHKQYILFGGMPEAAAQFLSHGDIAQVSGIQDQILKAYQLDFMKSAGGSTTTRIQQVWNSLPSQLAKENKKFLYKVIKKGARAREYEESIQWLLQAGLVYKISRVGKPGLPLSAYEDLSSFKLYVFETGLLMRLAGLQPHTFFHGDGFFQEFKGSIAENHVAQALRPYARKNIYYWNSDGRAEIDFLIEVNGQNVPIEVKSGKATKAKSLSIYKERYKPKIRVRISNLNLNLTDDLLNIPSFYAAHSPELIKKALNSKH